MSPNPTKSTPNRWIKGIWLPGFFLAFWLVSSWVSFIPSFILPSPDRVWKAAGELWNDQGLLKETETTLLRVLEGFAIGTVFGFVIGTAMGFSRAVERIFAPSFHLYRQIPLPGWIPILIIAFGNTEISKIILVAMGAFPPMALNTHAGIRNVSQKLVEVGEVFGFSRLKLFWRVVAPAALPAIWTGLKVSLYLAWMFVIAAELMTYSAGGLGSLLDGARDQFRLDIMMVLILLIGVLGFVMSQALEWAQRWFLGNRKFR